MAVGETVLLEGGPYDGRTAQVARDAPWVVIAPCGDHKWVAYYTRVDHPTKGPVFRYQGDWREPAVPEPKQETWRDRPPLL